MARIRSGRLVGLALALVGAGLLVWAASVWSRGTQSVEQWRVRQGEGEAELRSTWAELHEVNLRYQAFQRSIPSIPDSLRATSGVALREQGRSYEKTIHKLEFAERDIKLAISDAERKEARASAERKARTLPIAAAGAAVWVCAALFAMVSRPRREAA